MQNEILNSVSDAVKAAQFLQRDESLAFIESAAKMIADCYKRKGKLLIAGNGGSLCDAMHFAEELTGYFRHKRMALPAIALSEPGHLTCVSNDQGFEDVFSRGVEAYCRSEDILIVLTTSGNSENLVRAVEVASEFGIETIGFLGKSGGRLKGKCSLEWIVSGFDYSDRVQEAHMAAIHIIIEMVELQLFAEKETHPEAYASAAYS
ncbi:MAG: SIS domain-containing protein [Simkaniaceae bacterium]|nr:SIS domain-containing protein [Simkaniaceae bacterium]